jgi:ElaB/YqjD/DUF883 family membrane-anchored ribosome-binding protein
MSEKRKKTAGHTAAAEARRTIEEVRRLLDETVSGEELGARLAEVRERLHGALRAIPAAVEGAAGDVEAAAEHLPEALKEQVAVAERRIRENPLGAVLVAAGLGLLAGLVLRRR